MTQRESNLIWLRDVLDHLTDCHEQLKWAEDSDTVNVVMETMLRDLDCCRRLCETIRRRTALQHAA